MIVLLIFLNILCSSVIHSIVICPSINFCFVENKINNISTEIGVQFPINNWAYICNNDNCWIIQLKQGSINLLQLQLQLQSRVAYIISNNTLQNKLSGITFINNTEYLVSYFNISNTISSNWTYHYYPYPFNVNLLLQSQLPFFIVSTTPTTSTTTTTSTSTSTTTTTTIIDYAFCNTQMCVKGNKFTNNTVQITMINKNKIGWIGLGLGTSMLNSNIMFIKWNNLLQIRSSNSHSEPSINNAINFNVISDNTFELNSSYFDISNPQTWIWAISDITPSSNSLSMHSDKGIFTVNMFKPGDQATTIIPSIPNEIFTHGMIMFFVWNVICPIAIYIAMFGKNLLGVWWFRLHAGLFILGVVVLQIIGFTTIYNYITIDHFSTPHRQLGLFVITLSILQVILGFIIDRLWSPTRTSVPWYDRLHWLIGRVLVITSIVTIILGLIETNISYNLHIGIIISYPLYLAFVIILFVITYKKVGVITH